MRRTSMALAAALSLAAGASLAQPAPPPGPAPHAHGERGARPDPAQMAERHAQRLRDALQLRPDQEPALKALIGALQPPPGEMARMRGEHEQMRSLPTPQRLDRMEAKMAEHQARFRQHSEAIKRFYAQLTPTQQKAFDAMPMMGHEGMGGMHGMRGHGMRGGPGMKHGAPGGGAPPEPPPAPGV